MSRRHVAAAVTGLLCLGTLTACGAGRQAQTYKQHTYDYLNVDQGDVAIRNFAIDGPDAGTGSIPLGGTARATGTLVDQSSAGDTLTSASSPDADSVTLEQDGATATSVAVPARGRTGNLAVVLTGTHVELRGGSYVTMTLEFAKAGRITLRVPVRSSGFYSGTSPQPYAPPTAEPFASSSAEPTASSAATPTPSAS